MSDLVVTCPKDLWLRWLAEGDCAGDRPSGEEWGWWLHRGASEPPILPGELLYVVAWGRLRGAAPVTRVVRADGRWIICRRAGAVALTLPEPVLGFRGWKGRWWLKESEVPFLDWKFGGVGCFRPGESAVSAKQSVEAEFRAIQRTLFDV